MAESIIPKQYLKKKNVLLYKAYMLQNGDEMLCNTDIDIFAFTREAAVQYMINNSTVPDDLKGKDINFLIIKVDKASLLSKPLVDRGDAVIRDDCISLTLNGKLFSLDVDDKFVADFEVDINPNTNEKVLKKIELQ